MCSLHLLQSLSLLQAFVLGVLAEHFAFRLRGSQAVGSLRQECLHGLPALLLAVAPRLKGGARTAGGEENIADGEAHGHARKEQKDIRTHIYIVGNKIIIRTEPDDRHAVRKTAAVLAWAVRVALQHSRRGCGVKA